MKMCYESGSVQSRELSLLLFFTTKSSGLSVLKKLPPFRLKRISRNAKVMPRKVPSQMCEYYFADLFLRSAYVNDIAI